MTKRVLNVGSCRFDHASISRMIESNFDAAVVQTHGEEDTLAALCEGSCDLVLVNRVLNRDRTDGVRLIEKIKTDERFARLPVMLITNYEEHQQSAVDAGAQPGFGKQALSDPDTLRKLARILGDGSGHSTATEHGG
jgi:CheY-like chemotaxis protein